jgi:hypothetical protein
MFEYLYLLYEFGLCKIYYITSHNEDKPCPLKKGKYNNRPSTFLYSIFKSYRNGKSYHERIFHIYKIKDRIPLYYIEKMTNYSNIYNSDYVNQVQYYDTFEEVVGEMHVILNNL